MRRVVSVALTVGLTASVAVAGSFITIRPLQAQQATAWAVRVEAGRSENHDGTDKAVGGALRVAVPVERGDNLRLEAGLIAGPPYVGLDGGIEVRVPPRWTVKVLLRAGGGLLFEEGFTGAHGRVGAGLELPLHPRFAVRLAGHVGTHGGQSGPHLLAAGLEYRSSRSR